MAVSETTITEAAPLKDWERYLADDDEGLGTVYECLVLNGIMRDYRKRFRSTARSRLRSAA